MRRLILAATLLCAAAIPASAFPGRVVDDRTGQPIANAEVSVLGMTGSVKTDAEGRFSWNPDPKPPFEILVILSSGVLTKPVLIETITDGELTVRVRALSEQVTVSGAAPSIDAAPASGLTSISGRDLEVRQPENLIQALENVAGVNQVSEGHAGVPSLRGLSAGRTLILIDGGRVTSERRVGPSATFLDPSVLEGVEVARGPGSVAYGSDAFGGVIAARTRRVEAGSPLQARAMATLGTGVPEERVSVEAGRGFTSSGLFAQAHYRNAEDYDSPEGEVFNSGWQDAGVLARTTHAIGSHHLSFGWQSDWGVNLERPRNNSASVRFLYPKDTSHRLTANYRAGDAGPLGAVSIDALFGTYRNVTDQDTVGTPTQPRAVERADVRATDYQLRAVSERTAGPARLMTGIDFNGRFDLDALDINETYDLAGALVATRENLSIDGAHRHDAGIFAQLDGSVAARVSAAAGARYDYVTTNNPGGFFGNQSTANGALSGFASATAGPFNGLAFTAQVARGFRDPVLSDRYFRGPSGRGFITGNPDLEPEKSLQFDGAVRFTAGRGRVGLNAYHYEITDLIERFGDDDNFFFRNRGSAIVKGVEAEAQATLPAAVTLELTAQLSRGETPEDDAALDGIAPATVTALARKLFGTRGFGQARLAWFAEDDRPGPTEREVNGYTLVDLAGGVNLTRRFEVRAQLRNLFDATYFAAQSTRAVLGPGRSVAVTFVARY